MNQDGHEEKPPAGGDPYVGVRLADRYDVLFRLGAGGQNAVYAGRHVHLGNKVAIKFLLGRRADSLANAELILRESRVLGGLGHPHICEARDAGVAPDGTPFLVLELLSGRPLTKELESLGRLPQHRALDIAWQVATALSAAHDRGIVHCDLTPDNVWLAGSSAADRVKVLGFGVAGEAGAGEIRGSPGYTAPEVLVAPKMADDRADTYSLGALLYTMLAGVRPYSGVPISELVETAVERDPEPLQVARPDVAPAVLAFVERAMARDASRRFASMPEVLAALEDLRPVAPDLGVVPAVPPAAAPSVPSAPAASAAPAAAGAPATQAAESASPRPPTRSPEAALPKDEETQAPRPRRSSRVALALIAVALLATGGAALLVLRGRGSPPPASPGSIAIAVPAAPAPAPAGEAHAEPSAAPPTASDPAAVAGAAPPAAAPPAPPVTLPANPPPAGDRRAAAPATTHQRATAVARAKKEADRKPPAAPASRPRETSPAPTVAAAPPAAHDRAPSPVPLPPPPRVEAVAAPPPAPEPARPAAIDAAALQRLASEHRTAVEGCIAEDPSVGGKLVLEVTATPDGAVGSVTSRGGGSGVVRRCIMKEVRSWRLPAAGREASGVVSIDLD